MAKRNDTSNSHPARSPKASGRSRSTPKPLSTATFDALEDAIDEERGRLMRAHSLLNCIAIAMDAEDISPGSGPHYPTLIETARDLVNESINRLDSVNLGRKPGKTKLDEDDDGNPYPGPIPGSRGKYEVRELAVPYVTALAGADPQPWVPGSEFCDQLKPMRRLN